MKPAQLLIALMFLVLLFAFRDALHEHTAERPLVCEYPVDEAAATYIRGYREGAANAKP